MKTTIDHLPEDKQQTLREISALFTVPRKGAPVQMLILFGFGSHARGDAKALLLVLRSRGVEIPSDVEQRILGCTRIDANLLTAWLQRAASVHSAAELLAS